MNLEKLIGLGVAGNFAGHLEQAGEASDFLKVKVKDPLAPKALFPFYLPYPQGEMANSFLKNFPLTSDSLTAPTGEGDNLQIEPEVGVFFKIIYDGDLVKDLEIVGFAAYNDSSIRRKGAKKISEKKNWGSNTKGVSSNVIATNDFSENSLVSTYRICSYLLRDGKYYEYGVNSAARDYSYMYERLKGWIIDKMNNQVDEGPAENIHSYILSCNKPEFTLVSIGATRYTPFGESTYLHPGDTSIVVVYPEDISKEEIENRIKNKDYSDKRCSFLIQEVK
ncbi:MAG: DUF5718 family protein [Succinivibrionaceae bacterium]|nr:DUF5718 family protein [Ruminobacter sp.]MEE1340482.1 DUF5718 family protein [Succinivibrionaceae bacterium]